MQLSQSMAYTPLAAKYRHLIWSALDCDLPKTALFYAERYFYSSPGTPSDPNSNHDARHLLAQALVRCGQVHSAQNIVQKMECGACAEVYAQCCSKLGNWRQAQEALGVSLSRPRLPDPPGVC